MGAFSTSEKTRVTYERNVLQPEWAVARSRLSFQPGCMKTNRRSAGL